LRPHLDRLWGALTTAEQDAFLRHLARPWECHRHRMAPRVAALIAELRGDGRFTVRAGGIRGVSAGTAGGAGRDWTAEGADLVRTAEQADRTRSAREADQARTAGEADLGPTAGQAETGRPGGLTVEPVDGPNWGGGLTVELADGPAAFGAVINCAGPGRLPASADPLTARLLDTGLARVGPHGLGLDVDPAGRVIAADGTPHGRLRLVGPLRRGTVWETTAVPEIRAQARRLADDLAAHDFAGDPAADSPVELRPAA
jgi:uncharacterized NAD(P)/FAD-binding protein YdhS